MEKSVAVPVNVTLWEPPLALSVMARDAERLPLEVGLKFTLIMQFAHRDTGSASIGLGEVAAVGANNGETCDGECHISVVSQSDALKHAAGGDQLRDK